LPRRDAAAPPPAAAAEGGEASTRAAHDAAAAPSARSLRLLSMPASYGLLGLMIALSAALANGSLAFVSQPVKVLFKSSKLLPVMFFRALLGNAGANSWADYAYGAALALGLTLFSAGDAATELAGQPDAAARGAALRSQAAGVIMLLGSVSCDAVAPNLQERLLRRFAQPKRAVILHTNWLSAVLTAAVWLPSGEARAAVRYLRANPRPARMLALQSLAGYAGVLSYLGCIRYAVRRGACAPALRRGGADATCFALRRWLDQTGLQSDGAGDHGAQDVHHRAVFLPLQRQPVHAAARGRADHRGGGHDGLGGSRNDAAAARHRRRRRRRGRGGGAAQAPRKRRGAQRRGGGHCARQRRSKAAAVAVHVARRLRAAGLRPAGPRRAGGALQAGAAGGGHSGGVGGGVAA